MTAAADPAKLMRGSIWEGCAMNDMLLARARQGDEAAFEELLAEYKQLIWSCCWKFMGNREDAEDCYVEAAARIWKNLSYYQPGRSLKSWICTVTVNVCRNILDAQIRRGKNVTDSLNKEITDSGDELEDAVADDRADTERAVLLREDLRELRRCIARLPEDQRQSLVLVRLEGMSYAEAAEAEGVAEGTVKSRVNRAVIQLKKWMEATG